MCAPWRLEQVVHAFGDVHVEARVGEREDNLDENVVELLRVGALVALLRVSREEWGEEWERQRGVSLVGRKCVGRAKWGRVG